MKHYLLLCFTCAVLTQANAQFGITAASTQSHSTEWQVVTENFVVHRRADFLRYGTTAVIDYAFKLKNGSIRLRPALQLMLANSVYRKHYFQASTVGLEGNFEFALSAAKNKAGKKMPLRPFLQLSPGISMVSLRYEHPKDDLNDVLAVNKSRSIAPNFGANLFFEVKLSPLLTVAPMAGMRFYPHLNWKDFTAIVTKGTMNHTYDQTNWMQYHFGLRVGLNFK